MFSGNWEYQEEKYTRFLILLPLFYQLFNQFYRSTWQINIECNCDTTWYEQILFIYCFNYVEMFVIHLKDFFVLTLYETSFSWKKIEYRNPNVNSLKIDPRYFWY